MNAYPAIKHIHVVVTVLGLALGACATTAPRGELRQYACDDGTGFSADVSDNLVLILGPTGSVELPRDRRADELLYTNNLRTLILENDRARYVIGRRAWTDCRRIRITPLM